MINPYEVFQNDFYEWKSVGNGWKEKVWLDVHWTKRLAWAIRIVFSQALFAVTSLAVILSLFDWTAVVAMFLAMFNMLYVGFVYSEWYDDQFRKTDRLQTLDGE